MEDEGSGQPASSGLLECACVGIIDLLHSDPGVQTSFSPAALPIVLYIQHYLTAPQQR
jgi:hypothetical protein|eukprot:COSAG06_NODE_2544_length_6701_cov_3.102545_4_plen_58_part_00